MAAVVLSHAAAIIVPRGTVGGDTVATTTVNPTLKSALEARLAAIHARDGITPWSEAEEKLAELAAELVDPYLLDGDFDELRESETTWSDRCMTGAVVRAIEAAERVLVDRLALSWSDPPDTLLAHPENRQLRADMGIHIRETVPA